MNLILSAKVPQRLANRKLPMTSSLVIINYKSLKIRTLFMNENSSSISKINLIAIQAPVLHRIDKKLENPVLRSRRQLTEYYPKFN